MVKIITYKSAYQDAVITFLLKVWTELGRRIVEVDADLFDIPNIYQTQGGEFWIALDANDQIVGTAAIGQLKPGIAEFKRFYVRRENRGQGIGQKLLQVALGQATASGFLAVRLDTRYNADAALYLFRKVGFVEIERYHSNLFAQVFMEKSLTISTELKEEK